MNQPSLEMAKPSDLKAVLELEQLCFNAESFTRRQLRYLISKAKGHFLLSRKGNQISAFMVLLGKKNSSFMRLYSIAVSPNFRGRGLARHLLTEAAKLAKADGFRYIHLEVSEINEAAVKLYLCEGFEVFGERRAYYKNGSKALLMRKEV